MIDLAYSIADQNVETTKSIGIYNFSLHLAESLSQHLQVGQLTVFSNETVSPGLHLAAKARIREFNYAHRSKPGRMWWDQWGLYRSARATGHRWLFLPKGFASFLTRPRLELAAFVHDIMGEFYRQRYPTRQGKLESFYFSRGLMATLRQCRVVFTNTEFSKRELTRWAGRAGLPCPRVVVAGYGFDGPEPGEVKKENRILLFAGDMPHKRTDIAVRFLTRWIQESKYDGVIDCIGILAPERGRPAGPNWNWIGRVRPARAREMMHRSRAVIYVSEYEGFGMPPVEAILEGSCPVFSDIPPLREVMNGTGCAFSNASEVSFVEAMDRALVTPPEIIRAWSQVLQRCHHWPTVTERIVQGLSSA